MSPSGRFEIVRELTVGGAHHSGVFIVNDRITKKQAILKRLPRLNAHSNIREAGKMYRLKGHPHIVEILTFAEDAPTPSGGVNQSGSSTDATSEKPVTDEIYMQLCAAKIGTQTVSTLGDLEFTAERPIPEGFAWIVLESILRALCFLQFGVKDVMTDVPVPEWESIFYFDVTRHNIFLDDSDGDVYPRVLLGDFGVAGTPSELREYFDASSQHTPAAYRIPYEVWRDSLKSDAQSLYVGICGLLHEGWSEELEQIYQRLDQFKKDMDLGLLEFARHVVNTKTSLMASGKLRLDPLACKEG